MQVRTEQEALFMACEMEASAVQLYARAIALMEQLGREREPLYTRLCRMHADEKTHLARFRSFCKEDSLTDDQRIMLSATAEGLLFEGGLMGAARAGLLSDVDGMLRFAIRAEAASARKYREFAALAADKQTRAALELIASEEDRHLLDLQAQV